MAYANHQHLRRTMDGLEKLSMKDIIELKKSLAKVPPQDDKRYDFIDLTAEEKAQKIKEANEKYYGKFKKKFEF